MEGGRLAAITNLPAGEEVDKGGDKLLRHGRVVREAGATWLGQTRTRLTIGGPVDVILFL